MSMPSDMLTQMLQPDVNKRLYDERLEACDYCKRETAFTRAAGPAMVLNASHAYLFKDRDDRLDTSSYGNADQDTETDDPPKRAKYVIVLVLFFDLLLLVILIGFFFLLRL
eukprot:m.70217 g.70217  ORF g.70217 m.70217 type:complete len:111 (-) comp13767_c0_seq1:714-1046(-)